MITALEAIRWELSTLRLRVNCLEQAETVLGPLYAPMEPCQSPKSVIAQGTLKRSTRRHLTRAQVHEYIIAHGPITRRGLIEALGGPTNSMDKKLRRLVADGEIGVDGQRSGRRYRSPDASEVVSSPSIGSSKISTSRRPPDRGVYPMYDLIVDLGCATTEQLMRRTGLPTNLVVEQGRRLIQLGLVRFTGVGDARVWLPAQSEIIRDAA